MTFDIALNGILASMKNLQKINTEIASDEQFGFDDNSQQTPPREELDNSISRETKQSKRNLTEAMVESILVQRNIAANTFVIRVTSSMEQTLLKKSD